MDELIEEHAYARSITDGLVAATTLHRQGNPSTLTDIVRSLRTLMEFYPRHIAKEDKIFFPASRAYFTDAEDQAMLAEFFEFDRRMIHEKYRSVVDALEI
jgi:hemerythrin-like domain-containing protein